MPPGAAGRRAARGPVDPRLLRHARASRGGIILLSLIGFGQASATIAIAVALCGIVTAMTAGTPGVPAGTPAEYLGGLLPTTTGGAITMLAAAFAARGALSWAEQVTAQRTAARVTHELRRSLLDRVVRHGPAWVASYGTGRLTTVLGSGLEALRPWFSGYLPALVLGILLPPIVVAIMAVVDPASAIVALLTLPLIPLLGALIGWATKARAEQRWAADSRLAGHFLDVVRGLPTLRMYGRAERQIDVITDLTDRHRAATMRVLRVAFLSSTALDLVGTLAVGLIAVQAGLRVAAGSMELGPALLAILLAPEAYRPLREMAARYHASTDAGAVIADVDEILTTEATPSATGTGTPAAATGPVGPTSPDPLTDPTGLTDHASPTSPTGRTSPADLTGRVSPNRPAGHASPTSPPGLTSPADLTGRVSPNRPAGHASPTGAAGLAGSTGHAAPQRITLRVPELGHTTASPRITAATPVFGRAASGRWGVRATGLRARYPGAFEDALHLPELTVRAGELVALRGMSGAGKTTALRVLAGLHPAESGAIAVGSTFYLPQRPVLPHARTVAEAFPPDTTADELRSALHIAGLTGEITEATPLGEQVAGISAGQRQRLALAVLLHRAARTVTAYSNRHSAAVTAHQDRHTTKVNSRHDHHTADVSTHHDHHTADVSTHHDHHAVAVTAHRNHHAAAVTTHRDRRITPVVTLLLDEPTAHLDSAAERRVVDRLHQFAAQGCAVLVVAHRPALLAAADRVVELQPPAGTLLSRAAVTATVTNPMELPSWAAITVGTSQPGPAAPAGLHDGLRVAAAGRDAAGAQDLTAASQDITASQDAAGAQDVAAASRDAAGTRDAAASQDAAEAQDLTAASRDAAGTRDAAASQDAVEAQDVAAASRDAEGTRDAAASEDDTGRRRWARLWVAAGLGAGSSLAGIVLTGAAAWLLVRASSLPPVLSLSTAVVLVRGSAVARPVLRYLERLVAHEVAFARLGRRRAGVFADLIPHVPGPRLHRRGDLLTRLVDDVDATTDGLLRGRLPVIAAAVTAGLAVAVTTGMAVQAAVPVAVGLLVAGVLAPAVAARQADRQEAATGAARAALRDAVVETVDGVEELAGGGGRPDVPRERSRALADLEARSAREAGLAAAVAHLGWGAAAAGVAVVLARGALSAEWSAVLLLGVIALGEVVVSLPEAAIARRRAAGAEQRVAALIESGPGRGVGGGPGIAANQIGGGTTATHQGVGGAAVRVGELVAGWQPGRAPVLDGVRLELAPGSRTAIMGRSGCGKSTLAAVLAGLLPPWAGEVRVSGTAVLVGDETGHVFASTVRENLRLAAPAATDAQLRAVLARAGLGWMDLDGWLGAGGGTISGGQRRRLATARALLADPALLILDEPTEGIDESGARELMADLLDAASGRTVLVLAHRTDGLDLVDRILELTPNGLKEKNVGLDRTVL